MGKTLAELTTLTRQKANVEGNQVVTDAEIATYVNEAIKALYDLVISVDASYYMQGEDFTLASSAAGSIHILPTQFYKMRGLVIFPDTERETPVFLRTFAERSRARWGYTLDGSAIRVWPWQSAGQGPWRLYYVPKPPQLTTSIAVNFATTGNLNATGSGAGVGKTLTANANGTLSVDGNSPFAGDIVLVKNQANTVDNGIYTVTNAGSGGTKYVLTRAATYDERNEVILGIGIVVLVGVVNNATTWMLTAFGGDVDASPMLFGPLALDTTLDNFDEYVTNKAALMIFAKRQMSPGVVPALFSAAEERVKGMASMRASEPEQAPIMWAPGRRGSWYDDDDVA